MKLQVIATNIFPQLGTNYRSSLSGKSQQKKTPVRVTLGDPKRECQGYGLCRIDMGETMPNHLCPNAKIEFGLLISEYSSDVCWLIISKESWERHTAAHLPAIKQPSINYLKISVALAKVIGLQGNKLQVELPETNLSYFSNLELPTIQAHHYEI